MYVYMFVYACYVTWVFNVFGHTLHYFIVGFVVVGDPVFERIVVYRGDVPSHRLDDLLTSYSG